MKNKMTDEDKGKCGAAIGSNKDRENKRDENGNLVRLSGRYTKDDIAFMKRNAGKISIEEIAAQLRKNPDTIRKYMYDKFGYDEYKNQQGQIKVVEKGFIIKKSPIWVDLQNQFSEAELETFNYHWNNIILQFKNDILATERMQLIEFCRIEILINRCMAKLREVDVRQQEAKKDLEDMKMKPKDEQDKDEIVRMKMIIDSMIESHAKITRDYKELLDKKTAIVKDIKGSRADRIKLFENSKQSITSWMVQILESDDIRKQLGIEMKKQALALASETQRLAGYHTFINGETEQVILNADTIADDNL